MEALLEAIRNAVPCWRFVFRNGGCYGLFEIIRCRFPDAECYYDIIEGHVYTKVDSCYWDIEGVHDPKDHWIRIEEEPNILKQAKTWKCTKLNQF